MTKGDRDMGKKTLKRYKKMTKKKEGSFLRYLFL